MFRLSAQQGETRLVPGVPFATMGFNGTYRAPTIRAASGVRVRIHVTDGMRVPTTAHWHGMILPANFDGTPRQTIIPGETWTAAWQINQPAATLWYHPHPLGQTELQVGRGLLSPGERAEILLRLPAGVEMVLRSAPHVLEMSSGDTIASGARDSLDLLRITGATSSLGDYRLPEAPSSTTRPLPADPVPASAATERHFTLENSTINGRTMDLARIDTVVAANTTERWTVTNMSSRAHNFHIHGTQFRVTAVNRRPPETKDAGVKDTVLIRPGSTVDLLVPFSAYADPATPYMYHCHLLWHEEQGMMAQYAVAP